jgi:4-amino-4-deoxy-L-arabinose transferase-like glycosyltransferase
MINWVKKNKFEFALLLAVLSLALLLRLFKIDQFMTFLGDEGRDVRVVRDLIRDGNLVFIGPQTSVGNMYLGPLYYYLMAPALFLSNLNPVGPAVMIALLSVLTVLFTWYVARNWFGKQAAFISAILYAVSPVAIIYGRTSWNPNPMPFFALLSVWGIYQVWQNKKFFWLPLIGISSAFALQMHYLGLLLLPTIGLFWMFTLNNIKKENLPLKVFVKNTIIAILLFLFLMSPLVLFDLKHHGMNYNAFKALLSAKSGVFNLGDVLTKPFSLLSFSESALLSGNEKPKLLFTVIACLTSAIFLLIKRKQSFIQLISVWIIVTVVGLSLYNQPIYIHYLGLIYPAIFLLVGAVLASTAKTNPQIRSLSFLLLALVVAVNLRHSPAFDNPNRQLQRTEAAVDLIIKESKGEPFNFGLIAKQNYDESYRYFLENKKSNLVRGEVKIVDQLFVICEDGDKCQPEGHPDWQIAVFGPSHVVSQWQIDYLKIYRLEHTR